MTRLQKKCAYASVGTHLLLIGVLFVGPGFLSPNRPTQDIPPIDFIPFKTVDAMISGGGNPNAKPPPAAPIQAPLTPPAPAAPAPAPAPKPAPVETKPQPREIAKPDPAPQPKDDAESLEIGKSRKHRVEVSTTLIKRNKTNGTSNSSSASAQRAQDAKARERAAAAIGQTLAGIQGNLSGSTDIELNGPGGGGVPYANFLQAVKKIYSAAWVVPDGVADDSATTAVSVTIARDGRVVSAKIVNRSGNAAVDSSVQMTLDRVRYAAPLPDDASENQRTVTINFNVKAKLLG
jgi:TonB family protein